MKNTVVFEKDNEINLKHFDAVYRETKFGRILSSNYRTKVFYFHYIRFEKSKIVLMVWYQYVKIEPV